MSSVPIHELKRRISELISEAEAGERVVILRHRRPVAVLGPLVEEHVHVGARFGRAALASIFDEPATKGRYLDALREDREGER